MEWQTNSDDWQRAAMVVGFFLAVLFLIVVTVRAAKRKAKKPSLIALEEVARMAEDAATKCPCGEVATIALPVLERGRGAWDYLRNLYGAPPRYTRRVDAMRAPVVCATHAHVADAMLDQFIFGVRSDYAKLNAEVAARAAGFEQEGLLRQIGESLTDNQKRATRSKNPPVRLSGRGGEPQRDDGRAVMIVIEKYVFEIPTWSVPTDHRDAVAIVMAMADLSSLRRKWATAFASRVAS